VNRYLPQLVALATLLGTTSPPRCACADQDPWIREIRGASSLEVRTNTKPAWLVEGDRLQPGDQIKTLDRVKVMLEYPDQTRVVLGPGTEFEHMATRDDGLRVIFLNEGYLRLTQPKPLWRSTQAAIYLRSKNQVIRFAGSDLAYQASSRTASSRLDVFEGVAEVALDLRELESGPSLIVKTAETYSAPATAALGAASSFDPSPFDGIDTRPLSRVQLWRLRAQSLLIRQQSGGAYLTASAGLHPSFLLTPSWRVGLATSIFSLARPDGSERALAWSGAIMAETRVAHLFWMELGAGVHSWAPLAKTGPEYRVGVQFPIRKRSLLDAIVASLTYYDRPSTPKDSALLASLGVQLLW
jgi:hypothetical protein